jgi:hypothetical protein
MICKHEELAISAARSFKDKAVYTGKCLFCEEPVASPQRWCDTGCRDLFEMQRRMFAK